MDIESQPAVVGALHCLESALVRLPRAAKNYQLSYSCPGRTSAVSKRCKDALTRLAWLSSPNFFCKAAKHYLRSEETL